MRQSRTCGLQLRHALAGAPDAGGGTTLLPPLPSTDCPQNSPYFLVLIARPSAMAAASVEFLVSSVVVEFHVEKETGSSWSTTAVFF
jgi:hypothetical protein